MWNFMMRLVGLVTALTCQTSTAAEPLKIGTLPAFAVSLEAAAAQAKQEGLNVEIVEFTDSIAPNLSLANGDIDMNYYQYTSFLDNAKEAAGFDLIPYAPGIITDLGLYSKKYRSLADVPQGATVAIANDPINGGRGLQLLAKAGLIKLAPGVGFHASEDDIIENPRHLKLIPVELIQLVRAYDDADVVQGLPHHIRLSKHFDPASALLYEGGTDPAYVIQFVIRPQDKADPRLAQFVAIYQHSPVVKAALDEAYGRFYRTAWSH